MNINNAVSVNCGQKRDSACKVKNLDNKVIKIYSDFEFEEGLVKFGIFKDRSEEIPKIRSKIPNLRMLRASKKCQKRKRCKTKVKGFSSDIKRNIARGTTDPGYCLFNLSYLSI